MCVNLLSSLHSPKHIGNVSRNSKDGTQKLVSCSKVLIDYNKNINFVDNFDRLNSDYKLDRKSAITANIKNKTWEVLTKTFNTKSLNGYRNEKCLRSKYDNLKKTVKIKLREVKSKPCPTGGGPAAPQKTIEKLSIIEEKIRSLNPLAFNGTTSQFDNDCIDNENMKLIDELDLENDEVEIVIDEVDCQENNSEDLFNTTEHFTEIDWANYTPAKLKTTISKQLSHSLITPQNRSSVVCATSMYDNESSDNDLEESKTIK
ncbi:hypothetical protein ACI65C_004490 [Semiaphis heraclei]